MTVRRTGTSQRPPGRGHDYRAVDRVGGATSVAAVARQSDVDDVTVELYGLAPDQFTAARSRVAKAACDAGDSAGSAAIKALRTPTLAAWLANLLVRAAPDGVSQLTELGEELRQAHIFGDGSRLNQLIPRRHNLVQELVKAALVQAREHGHTASEQIVHGSPRLSTRQLPSTDSRAPEPVKRVDARPVYSKSPRSHPEPSLASPLPVAPGNRAGRHRTRNAPSLVCR
jgi:hypothetical protein